LQAAACRDSGKALRTDGASRVRQLFAEPAKIRIRCRSGRYCGREPAGSASPTACRPARSRPRCAVDSATRPDHRCPQDACAAGATVGASANPIAVNPTKVRRRHIVRPHQCPSRCRARESVVPLAIGTDVLRWVDRRRFCAASGNGCFRLRLRASTTPTARLGTRWRLRRLRPVSAVRQGTIELRAGMDRQGLLHRPESPRCEFFIHDQALRLPSGGTRVMHEQVLHLVLLSPRLARAFLSRGCGR
jgi:hypothetical protein